MLPRSVTRPPDAERERLRDAARSLESLVLKQLVTASGAFKGGEGAGAGIRADLFATTLADTLAKGGGIGLAAQLERTLGAAAPAPTPGPPTFHPYTVEPRAYGGSAARTPVLPVAGRVTSAFGTRTDPFTGAPAAHRGVDVAAPEGTPIRAALGGVVLQAGPRGNYGDAVEIDHGDGTTSLYAHASALLVAPGERVEAGQEIARVGRSGRATGAHLHFEVRQGARPVDPSRALKEYAGRADGSSGAGS